MGKLFDEAPAADWHFNAVADRFHDSDSTLASGYQRAADLVVTAWPKETFDPLLAPIILLYRHAIELELKTAIRAAERAKYHAGLPHRDPDAIAEWFKDKAGHRLGALKDDLKTSLASLGTEDMYPEVEGVIDDLHDIDPSGETFRYAWTRKKDQASGLQVVTKTPRPGELTDGRVNVVELGRLCSAAVDHIGAIWTMLEEEYVAPHETS